MTRRAETPSPFAAGLLFAFTAAYMYEYDRVEADASRSRGLDRQLLEQLVAPEQHGHLLDPRAIHQVERRLRGLGQPPRSAAEMAEWLRRLGDLTAGDLEGPMAAFLEELEADGRAWRIELPGVPRTASAGCSTEEAKHCIGRRFALTGEPTTAEANRQVRTRRPRRSCLRFLATHALVGSDECWPLSV